MYGTQKALFGVLFFILNFCINNNKKQNWRNTKWQHLLELTQ
jgi:hypothetical protein